MIPNPVPGTSQPGLIQAREAAGFDGPDEVLGGGNYRFQASPPRGLIPGINPPEQVWQVAAKPRQTRLGRPQTCSGTSIFLNCRFGPNRQLRKKQQDFPYSSALPFWGPR